MNNQKIILILVSLFFVFLFCKNIFKENNETFVSLEEEDPEEENVSVTSSSVSVNYFDEENDINNISKTAKSLNAQKEVIDNTEKPLGIANVKYQIQKGDEFFTIKNGFLGKIIGFLTMKQKLESRSNNITK